MKRAALNATIVVALFFGLILPFFQSVNKAEAATIRSVGSYTWTDSGGNPHMTAKLYDGDTLVYCYAENELPPSYGGTRYKNGKDFTNYSVISLLYYGYGGGGYHGSGGNKDYVKTWVALNNWKSGNTGSYYPANNDSFIKSLYKHARKRDAPKYGLKFNKKSVISKITTVNGKSVQKSQSIKVVAQSDNFATLKLPKRVTIHVGNRIKTGGSIKVYGGQSIYFTAPLNYNSDYKTGNVNSWEKKTASLLYLPNEGSYQPVLQRPFFKKDPLTVAGFKVHFFARQATLNYKLVDKHNDQILQKGSKKYTIGKVYDYRKFAKDFNGNGEKGHKGTHYDYDTYHGKTSKGNSISLHHKMPSNNVNLTFYYIPQQHERYSEVNQYNHNQIFEKFDVLKNVGHHFSYTPDQQVNKSKNIYDLISKYPWTGTLGYKNVSHNFYYVLRRQVTVNYLDLRTGKPIRSAKTYMKHQGDAYSESHPAIKTKDGTAYHYVKATGAKQSEKIGTDNITINYYYELPLMQVGVQKLQIYTAPADQGLPVRVQLEHKDFYGESLADMGKKTIHVSLYRGTKRLNTQKYTARAFPDQTTFKISSNSGLQVNEHQKYTIKLDGYNQYDFSLIPKEEQLTTDGYTSSEDTVRLNLQTDFDHQDLQQRVVMTEVTPTTSEKPYYEHFNYGAPPLPAKKTGYGVETKATLNYWSELGQDYQYGTKIDTNKLTFAAPATLQTSSQDKTSKINYPVKNGNVNVPLFASLNHAYFSSGTYYHAYTWIFPHVNVEKKTGYLYLDNQVASHNVRDGGNKFYTPIWPDKKENIPMNYPVGYASNKIGVNKINVVMTDRLRIYAYMLGWMGSPTIKQDQILLVPVDEDHPFASGKPTNWTKDDIDWVKHFNP